MKAVFLHIESEAVVTVECKQIYFGSKYYAVRTNISIGYFPHQLLLILDLTAKTYSINRNRAAARSVTIRPVALMMIGEKGNNMEILKTNIDLGNKVKVYKLTKSSGTMVQEAPAGLSVPVSDWMLYNDPKEQKDGTLKDNIVLSFLDTSGVKYCTVSSTFQREFLDILDIMEGDAFAILIVHGKTKAGKDFVSCELDCDFFN